MTGSATLSQRSRGLWLLVCSLPLFFVLSARLVQTRSVPSSSTPHDLVLDHTTVTLPVDSIRPDIRRHLTAEDGSTVLVYRMLGFVLGEKRERDVPTDCDLMNAEIAEDEERPATGWRCLGVHVLGDLTMASFAVTESGAVDLLLKHGDSFDAVRVDRKVSPAAVQSLTPPNHEEDWLWNLDLIDEAKVAGTATDGSYTRDEAYNGDGVLVYIIDTGIDKTHAPSGLSAAGKVVDIYTADTSVPPSYDDWNGHGTHVAATIGGQTYGVADGVTLLNVNVFGTSPTSSHFDLIMGLRAVQADVMARTAEADGVVPAAVVNISVGERTLNAFVEYAIRYVTSTTGAPVVLAAGNTDFSLPATSTPGGDACLWMGAAQPETITVGSVGVTAAVSPFSNRGPCVDIFAPGEGIWSARAANAVADIDAADSSRPAHLRMSGTSMAAAHVSGVAAILLQGQSWVTGASVRRTLQLAAIPAVVGHMQASAGVGYTGAAFTDRFLNVLRLPQRAFVVSVAFPDGDIESSEVEVTAPGQYTFRVRMPVAPSAPVTVSLTLAAADSAGMSLSRSSLAFMETDWETPQDVVLTVEGELAGPSALAFVDLEAQSDDAGLDGAVLAVAIRDARIPLGDTPEEPLVVGPGAMNADGTVTVDMGPWEWTRSPLMDDRSLFTCKGVSQGTTVVYPNGPDLFFAFRLEHGCGATKTEQCEMRFSTCGSGLELDTTLQVFELDAIFRTVVAPVTVCSDDWTLDPGCTDGVGVTAACLAKVADLRCSTEQGVLTDAGVVTDLKSFVEGTFQAGVWYVAHVGTWLRDLTSDAPDAWRQRAGILGSTSLPGTLPLTIKIDNLEGGAPAMSWLTTLPPMQERPPPPPPGPTVAPSLRLWLAKVLFKSTSTTITAAHVRTLKQAVSDLAQVSISTISIDLQFRRSSSRRALLQTTTQVMVTVTAGSEEEGRILGGRVAGIITRGDLEERMIAMGASIGRLTLASPDPIVENALGPDPVYVDVYKEVPVEVVQEVRVKDRTVVSLTAALLIVLAAVLGAAAGLVGHRLYVRARGPDQDDIARLYHDKETRHLLAGHSSSQSPPHSRPASRSVSRTHTRTRTHTRGQSERPPTAMSGATPTPSAGPRMESQRSMRSSALGIKPGRSQRTMEAAAMLAKAQEHRNSIRMRSQRNLMVARTLRAHGSFKDGNVGAISFRLRDQGGAGTPQGTAEEDQMAEVARLVEDADSQVQAAEERRRRTLNMVPSQRLGSPHEEEVEQGFGSDRWDPPHRGDVPFSSEVAPSAVLVEGPMRGFSGRGGAEVLRATPAPSESAPNAAGPAATEAPMAGEISEAPTATPAPSVPGSQTGRTPLPPVISRRVLETPPATPATLAKEQTPQAAEGQRASPAGAPTSGSPAGVLGSGSGPDGVAPSSAAPGRSPSEQEPVTASEMSGEDDLSEGRGGENPRENSSPGRGEVKGNEEGGTSGPQMPGSKRIKKPRAKAKSKVAKAWKKERA